MSSDQWGEFLEPLTLNRLRIWVAVGAARDVKRQLGRRFKPRVRSLLAQDVEDIAEHSFEWILTHAHNLKAVERCRHAPDP